MKNKENPLQVAEGLFVVFEGIDGVGKSTQIENVAHALKKLGYTPYITAEPSEGPYGLKLRQKSHTKRYAPDEELHLFLQDRRWHLEEQVKPALSRGEIVLQDRYYYSSIAYQGVSLHSPESIRQLNEEFVIPADLVFYLDLNPQMALARIQKGRSETSQYEKLDYLTQVRALFLKESDFIKLDATQDEKKLTQQILDQILSLVQRD